MNIESRKQEHIDLALLPQSQGPLTTLLEDVVLIHQALPEVSVDKLDTSVEFLGYKLGAPIIISGMTGGTEKAYEINRKLAEVAEEFRVAIGVGSQRAMINNPSLIRTYRVVREVAHSVPVISNIGFAQLKSLTFEHIETIVASIEADALAIHLNPAQELMQVEGDRDFEGIVNIIAELVQRLKVPIIVKEVGNGLSREVVEKLYSVGVKIFDVAGAGGTNWVKIELMRAEKAGKHLTLHGEPFIAWGIPTAAAVCEARSVANDITVIGSGGIRTGLDVAKVIALGADIAGIAQPFLKAVIMGNAREFIQTLLNQLRASMVLVGARNIEELKTAPILIKGNLAYWICARRLTLRNKQAYIYCCSTR